MEDNEPATGVADATTCAQPTVAVPAPDGFTPDDLIEQRLTYLAELESGWYDGDGEAVVPLVLTKARDVIDVLMPKLGRPGIFPTIEGGVSIEWFKFSRLHEVEVTPTGELLCSTLDRVLPPEPLTSDDPATTPKPKHQFHMDTIERVDDVFEFLTAPPTWDDAERVR